MSGGNSTAGRSVTEKSLAILDVFAGERTELTMSDIARATGLPSSTTHRLIQELERWGGLERGTDGRYSIGLRLWEVAARSRRTYGMRESALPFLQTLWDLTRAHVLFAVLDGSEALLIEKIAGTKDVPNAGRAGGRLPLHASAVGKVLLAHADPTIQARTASGELLGYTPTTIVDAHILRAELARVRREGYATSRDELTAGSTSCAALVTARDGTGAPTIAAVSALGSTGRRDMHEMIALTRSAAQGITRALADRSARHPISPVLPRTAKRARTQSIQGH
ncbi:MULTISPECIES: IclR family transcriptional regulator [unclassified Rhodococcus (in: high G+C Gram-positive bacteria)]|uniref:IclR family transcriptional regulator n=1 Tax=unclassified Rhodococcus (in: high G+C Gram-positive bacteria) TaxID=192944 RepID=UPI0015E8A1C6|nr:MULTISPECIES: IclR family transcriptional regulator [unclassified Rhodococcus (in: high G+C Gram-positive bacteria)]